MAPPDQGSRKLLEAMASVVGKHHAFTDRDLLASYERDWTGRFGAHASMVVRPGTTSEVAAVVKTAVAAGAPLVPQGGNTGLVGGGVPRGGEIVISLTRLKEMSAVDPALGVVRVGAGVTLGELQRHVQEAGFDAAMDFAARDACTVGGIVACDAGGIRALRHGTASARVVGLEAVLADGTIVSRMSGLHKDNAGLSLPRLLVGSEGTLGVITRVCWKVEALPRARATVLFGVPTVAAAIAALSALTTRVHALESCDFLTESAFAVSCTHQRRSNPLARRWPIYVIAEASGRESPLADIAEALETSGVDDVAAGDDTRTAAGLWALRERVTEAVSTLGVPHKMDVGIPLQHLETFLDRIEPTVTSAAGESTIALWGHLGDGNVHVNVIGPATDDQRVDDAVLRLAIGCGGTISAEHGIGTAKLHWLEAARGPGEVAAMRAIKRALDPASRLNPGVMLPVEGP